MLERIKQAIVDYYGDFVIWHILEDVNYTYVRFTNGGKVYVATAYADRYCIEFFEVARISTFEGDEY